MNHLLARADGHYVSALPAQECLRKYRFWDICLVCLKSCLIMPFSKGLRLFETLWRHWYSCLWPYQHAWERRYSPEWVSQLPFWTMPFRGVMQKTPDRELRPLPVPRKHPWVPRWKRAGDRVCRWRWHGGHRKAIGWRRHPVRAHWWAIAPYAHHLQSPFLHADSGYGN